MGAMCSMPRNKMSNMSRCGIGTWLTFLVVGAIFLGCPLPGQIVIFADQTLDSVVRVEIGHPLGFLSRRDLLVLTQLDAAEYDIQSLTGLEFAENLVFLNLASNQISNLLPLSNLTNIESLNLGGNPVFDLTPLAGLLNLSTLILSDTNVTDLQPLVTNAINGGLGEGDVVDLRGVATLSPTAEQQANQLRADFLVNVVVDEQ